MNLCIVAAYGLPAVRNVHGILQEICLFYVFSPKRQAELEKHIIASCCRPLLQDTMGGKNGSI